MWQICCLQAARTCTVCPHTACSNCTETHMNAGGVFLSFHRICIEGRWNTFSGESNLLKRRRRFRLVSKDKLVLMAMFFQVLHVVSLLNHMFCGYVLYEWNYQPCCGPISDCFWLCVFQRESTAAISRRSPAKRRGTDCALSAVSKESDSERKQRHRQILYIGRCVCLSVDPKAPVGFYCNILHIPVDLFKTARSSGKCVQREWLTGI